MRKCLLTACFILTATSASVLAQPFASVGAPALIGTAPLSEAADTVSGNFLTAFTADISDTPAGSAQLSSFVSAGPGSGLPGGSGSPVSSAPGAGQSAEGDLALDGLYVAPNYDRGDTLVAESRISDGNGGWIYRQIDAYDPTQDALYKVLREEDGWYVCAYFGGEIWLKKDHCTPLTSLSVGSVGDQRATILKAALSKLGNPYQYAGNGPDRFDCSGLVNYAYDAAGISVPRTSGELGSMANISREQLKPGDILWRSGHVAIYLGNNTVIHSEKTGTGVIAEKLKDGDYVRFVNAVGD